ncbi:phosphate regulon sensor histidine kinase PhoR [Chelativorans sp. M5D2P16]|uniref:phosphate regulon sensor histidine kinase PhoR n=1 Tax=Chelativorans sp. M5D2P16 TaxID=3095678 RepID=UPI002ACA6092|nr:phosphate regulon sensor histidine kinase PhoR [Chelativorans sp. M5D2P16]MDZ5697149.1 phosphate regulon sensor histidine kinase PhoR [Chelativorans sp. M5D2P16]
MKKEDAARGGSAKAALRRLARNWYILAAASAALLALDLFVGGSGAAAALAVAFVLAVAAFFPGKRREGMPEKGDDALTRDLGTLPALHLAAAVQDPLYVFDEGGTVVYANEAARTAFGSTVQGTSLQLRFRAPEMHDFIARVLEGGSGPFATDYTERVPIERAYRVSAMPIGEGSGLFVLLFKDQSEARRIDRMRADFIANASHELRTPLASIAGFIETLRGPARDDPDARENFLQIMQDQTARMARLIDDLLSLSRLEIKSHMKGGEHIDLKQLLESVRDSMAHLAAESNVAIELDLPEAPVEVQGDRDGLVQVFENLLENACKYGGSGGRVVITATAAEQDGSKRVTVTDFGPGIAEEHIPRITERFYRVDVENSRAQKGTGLGLSIVKHILARHGARLSIRSRVGEGSSFTVIFPPE